MEWLTIIAILSGPIVALRLQAFLDRRKEDRDRRLRVFKLKELIDRGLLAETDVTRLAGLDMTVILTADETRP